MDQNNYEHNDSVILSANNDIPSTLDFRHSSLRNKQISNLF